MSVAWWSIELSGSHVGNSSHVCAVRTRVRHVLQQATVQQT